MEEGLSWDGNGFSASQEIPPHFMEQDYNLPRSVCPILSRVILVQAMPSTLFLEDPF